jgi:hypothetical protein
MDFFGDDAGGDAGIFKLVFYRARRNTFYIKCLQNNKGKAV